MYSVLVVDDIEIMRKEIKRQKVWGEASGFEICAEARDGMEALQILENTVVDLVISDIRMPRIDGIELLRKISERKLCQCVVFLSDYTEFEYAREGMINGAFDYLGKPVSEEELLRLLGRVKEYLVHKSHEEHKLKRLEKLAEEKIEHFFPEEDIKYIVECLNTGNLNVSLSVSFMTDKIGASFNYDAAKAAVIIRKAVGHIVDEVIKDHNWILEIRPSNLLSETEAVDFYEWEKLKKFAVESVQNISSLLEKYEYLGGNNSNVRQICRYILTNAEGDTSLQALSENLFMSKTYISTLFKDKTGLSLQEYLTMIKMEKASKLLHEGSLKNYEIADRLGFKDIEYFGKLFKKYSGVSPSEFRQKRLTKTNKI